MSWKILVLAVPVGLLVFGSPAAGTDYDGHGEYVAFRGADHGLNDEWTPLCQQMMPRCITVPGEQPLVWDCSGSEGSTVQVGGVLFCDIPMHSTLSLQIEDALVEDPMALVVCLTDHPSNNGQYEPIKRIRGHGVVPLPSWCKPTPGPGPATTEVGVVLEGPPEGLATHGRVYRSLL